MSWKEPKYLFSVGPRDRFVVYRQRTPIWWWFRIISFGIGEGAHRRNGWHFYVPFMRLTRSAK